MLKSLLKEIIGAVPNSSERAECLQAFRGKCRVLVLFEGASDDRPEIQEGYLTDQQEVLASNDIALLRVAGGGVFSSLETPVDISVDDLRADLNGPSPEDFEAVLVDRDGAVVFRSKAPVQLSAILSALDSVSNRSN
ncbi:hypothetical protein ASE04_19065 [Rhizobium sp. Root708]|uniref:DUF4174 domain-containing protein n=1 Tax=Rhizobium sp. Root708 TaxID=1736592 RepID=UPI0006FEFD86|nr:DUF4174 domain-containing protein [Rhizobium sp. Root708]KRB49270.1 hypothetical protein ASE04_19065 [Rhizobium sp. Root708]